MCFHLATLQVSPELSLASDGQATAVQQRHHHDGQTHDETSQHSAHYSCNMRTEYRNISRWDATWEQMIILYSMIELYYPWSWFSASRGSHWPVRCETSIHTVSQRWAGASWSHESESMLKMKYFCSKSIGTLNILFSVSGMRENENFTTNILYFYIALV